jgi:23S rRNA A2030 N6-methylase RlmJ
MTYHHSKNAGNMGDVFKHLVLLGVVGHLFQQKKATRPRDFTFGYAESHCGAPEHQLVDTEGAAFRYAETHSGGEGAVLSGNQKYNGWRSGVLRLVKDGNFSGLQPGSPLSLYCTAVQNLMAPVLSNNEQLPGTEVRYPSSWRWVMQYLARDQQHPWFNLSLFDTNAEVAKSIKDTLDGDPARLNIEYSCSDGYKGVKSLGAYRQDLVFIDPPYKADGKKPSRDWVDVAKLSKHLHHLEVPHLIWYPFFTLVNPQKLLKEVKLPALEFLDPQVPDNNLLMKGSGMILGGLPEGEAVVLLSDLQQQLLGVFANIGIVNLYRP